MLKKLSLGFFVSILLVFSGCSQKDVEVTQETENKPKQEAKKEKTKSENVAQAKEEVSTSDSEAKAMMEDKKAEMVMPILNHIYFDYDKYQIKTSMRSTMSNNYKQVKNANYSGIITLEGHCDDRGSDEYNFALGMKRASTVKKELIDYGVNASQIKIVSYGENQPLCMEKNKSCWGKNRRVEHKISK